MRRKAKLFRTLLAFAVACCLLVTTIGPIHALAEDYSKHWAAETIELLVTKGIVKGDSRGNINPDKNITRAEFVALVNRTLKLTDQGTDNFPDVSAGAWYNRDFAIAKKAEYIVGDGKGNANPEVNVTRAEVVTILYRVLKFSAKEETNKFSDNATFPAWSVAAINVLSTKKLVNGYPDGTFKALNAIRRCEAFTVIANLIKDGYIPEEEKGGDTKPPTTNPGGTSGTPGGSNGGSTDPASYYITIQASEGGTIVAGTSGSFSGGTTISLSANAHAGYEFVEWKSSGGGTFANANSTSTTFVTPSAAVTVTAQFRPRTGGAFTRGEWIQLLADKLHMNLTINEEDADVYPYDYFYADTEASPHGMAIEAAQAYGILPPPDSEGYEDPEQDIPLFFPNLVADREFAAYTTIMAMGYVSECTPLCDDAASLKYPNEAGLAIQQGFLTLIDHKFLPSTALSVSDKNLIFAKIDEINASTEIDTSDPHDDTEYVEGVIVESLALITDYTVTFNSDGTMLVVLASTPATRAIQTGNVFVLPPNPTYVTGIALKAISASEAANDKLEILCSKPEIYEVLADINYEGVVIGDGGSFVPSEGVVAEYNPNGSIEDEEGEYPLNINAGGSVSVPGTLSLAIANKKIADDVKVSGKVTVEIPNITCKVDANIGLFSVTLNELLVSITEKIKLTGSLEFTLAESGYELTNSLGNTRWVPGKVELGRLPIALGTTGLSVDIVFFYNVNAKGTASISYTVVSTQGIQVRNGATRVIREFTQSLDAISVKGSFKAGLGIALRLNALHLFDLIGVDAHAGLGISVSYTMHVTGTETMHCGDGTIYAYLTVELDTDTVLGLVIKTVYRATWSWDIFDENSSPYKLKIHLENMKKVPKCTFGVGSISGYVREAGSNRAIANARVSINHGSTTVKQMYASSTGQFSLSSINQGDYTLTVSATGYSTYSAVIKVVKNQTTYVETLLMVDRSNTGEGTISGNITNALSGAAVSAVSYVVRSGWNSSSGSSVASGVTTGNGYSIKLAPGNYTIEFSKDGFMTTNVNVAIVANTTSTKHVALAPEAGDPGDRTIRIILTWGAVPADLDSHMFGPTVNGASTFHTYYITKDYSAGEMIAALDRDDIDSYGPETTTIYQMNTSGLYGFYVHDYSNRASGNSVAMSNSGAQVRVFSGNLLIDTFNIPVGIGGTLWHVFDYDAATDTIVPFNTFSYSGVPSGRPSI